MQVASELDNSNGSIEDGDGLEELEDGLLTLTAPDKSNGTSHHHSHHSNHLHVPGHHGGGGGGGRAHSPQFSHAYATLHPHPTDSYDNLNILGEDTVAVHL